MNCKFVFDAGINPAWTAVTDEDGKEWPVRDFYGTFKPSVGSILRCRHVSSFSLCPT